MLIASCVAKSPGTNYGIGGRVDPSWIDDWNAVAVPPPPGLPPAPKPVDPRFFEPESAAAALEIVMSSDEAAYHSSNGVYTKLRSDAYAIEQALHDRWRDHPEQRERLTTAYLGMVENGFLPVAYAKSDDGPSSKSASLSLDLLGQILDSDKNIRRRLLLSMATRMYLRFNTAVEAMLLERLALAPTDELPFYGAVLSQFDQFPEQHRRSAYEAICACVQRSSQIGPVDPSLGWVSPYLGNRIAQHPTPEGAHVLAEMIRLAWYRPGEYAGALRTLDPTWPETQEAVAAALGKDDRDLVLAALEIIRASSPLRRENRAVVRALASSYRADVRKAALEALPDDESPPPEPPPFVLPEHTAQQLLAMLPFDLRGARRCAAPPLIHSPWGMHARNVDPQPGWLFTDSNGQPSRFIGDNMDITPADGTEIAQVDFWSELAGIKPTFEGGNDWAFGYSGIGGRMIGSPQHDLLRLIYCVGIEQREAPYHRPRSSALYLTLLDRYASEQSLLEDIAQALATQRYLQCVHCYAEGDDELAAEHASQFSRYLGWTGWWSDLASFRDQVARIQSDIIRRRTSTITAPRDSLEYWLQRMPDLRLQQFSQPGVAWWTPDDEVLHGIASYGLGALLPLFDQLDDDRLVRGCGFWRVFSAHRYIYTVGTTAQMLIQEICRHFLGTDLSYTVWEPENRPALREWLETAVRLARH